MSKPPRNACLEGGYRVPQAVPQAARSQSRRRKPGPLATPTPRPWNFTGGASAFHCVAGGPAVQITRRGR